ncbi:MAG TPA: phosphoenolpyruvate carboxylase, partial [Rhodothermales bacterium]|nr:phosphoenolpyruvate carboxylase [Rhodothermales bacterium]
MPDSALRAAQTAGLSDPLARRVALAERLVLRVARERYGPDATDLAAELLRLSREGTNLDALAEHLTEVPTDQIEDVLRTLTAYFHLVNKAEQLEIVRVNRERALRATPEAPRKESLAEAVHQLAAMGATRDEALAFVQRLDIRPTLTAHPTEARRRTILLHQGEAAALLDRLGDPDLSAAEHDEAER